MNYEKEISWLKTHISILEEEIASLDKEKDASRIREIRYDIREDKKLLKRFESR